MEALERDSTARVETLRRAELVRGVGVAIVTRAPDQADRLAHRRLRALGPEGFARSEPDAPDRDGRQGPFRGGERGGEG